MHDDDELRPSPAGWEARYQGSDQVWSGKANEFLVDLAEGVEPGTALDLACGEGADALWLAEQGWTVTGVDFAPTAIERAASEADRRGLAERTSFVVADLDTWEPDDVFDLVLSAFFHSRQPGHRIELLRRASRWVAPGGSLVVVGHLTPPPWSGLAKDPVHRFAGPDEELAQLGLEAEGWTVVASGVVTKNAKSPQGEAAILENSIFVVRRG